MKPVNQFLDELWQSFMPLHRVAEIQTREFFDRFGKDKDMLKKFFHIRVGNERWNMVELAQKVANLPVDVDPNEARLLAKQAWDEAEHYRIVHEILEHLTGEPVDMKAVYAEHGGDAPDIRMGASLIKKYEAQDNPIMMHMYQYMAEGRASHVWKIMSQVAGDEYIQTRYARVARDEKFHSEIGRLMLEKLCVTEEAQQEALSYVKEMVWDLFECSCVSLGDFQSASDEVKQIMREAYGEPDHELCVKF